MRVAVVNWSSRRVGGVEEYVNLILPALARSGADVAFWHEVNEPLDRSAIVPETGLADFCAAEAGLAASLRSLRAWKPDVLYVQGIKDVAVERELLDVAPVVGFLHTYVGTCISGTKTFTRPSAMPCDRTFGWPCLAHYFPRGCGGNSPTTMMRLFEEQSARLESMRRYRCVLTHTEHMRLEMEKHGVKADVVPFPVHVDRSGAGRARDDSWRLLFAGRLEPLKGASVLLEAMRLVRTTEKRPIRLILAGDGTERPLCERRAREIERAAPNLKVEFTGWVGQPEIGALMESADLLVVPSLWPEPFGSVGPAAARCGVPAAGFAAGGIPQWLIDGVTGHLAPADPPTAAGLALAIDRALEDPGHYAALRSGAAEMARTFTMERHLPALISALERVVEPVPAT